MIEDFLEGNKKFVDEDFKKDEDHYSALSKGQSPKSLWIACSDSRVDPERITSSKMGEMFVHRNIGNLVPEDDLNVATVLEYAVRHLKVRDIVVCGHSNCGAMKALVSERDPEDRHIPAWLEYAEPVLECVGPGCESPDKLRSVEIENIRMQVENLKGYEVVKNALEAGDIEVHGVYYNLETGLLEEVV